MSEFNPEEMTRYSRQIIINLPEVTLAGSAA